MLYKPGILGEKNSKFSMCLQRGGKILIPQMKHLMGRHES